LTTERLSKTEERTLIELAQQGHNRALTTLIKHNEGLVHKIVSRFPMKNSVCSYQDLYQEGVMGFCHAIEKFDLDRDIRLSTYSYYWITARVRSYYHNHYRTVRLPVHVTTENTEVNRTIERLTREYGRVPTLDEVCSIHENADNVLCSSLFTFSLNSLVGEDGELQDLQGESYTTQQDEQLDAYFLLQQLRGCISDRDYKILIQRYGLDGNGERTLQELSDDNDVSRARVHQVINKALAQLKTIATK
jgi:RNA polymerase nonessential primary-like sigma factor